MNDLPLERAISLANPANNGEALLTREGDPVGSRELRLFDPVTTEAKAEMERPARPGKSTSSMRRRPSESRIDLPSYVAGYVDGEGCFCVSIGRQPRIQVGWEVRPSFSVSQNEDRSGLIRLLPHLLGCGYIRRDRSDRTLKFETRSLHELRRSVIPFFQEYPLMSSKRRDFELFTRVCELMAHGLHLQQTGIVQIAELAARMNSSGIRRYTVDRIKSESEVKG